MDSRDFGPKPAQIEKLHILKVDIPENSLQDAVTDLEPVFLRQCLTEYHLHP